jgi:hypothetical protein
MPFINLPLRAKPVRLITTVFATARLPKFMCSLGNLFFQTHVFVHFGNGRSGFGNFLVFHGGGVDIKTQNNRNPIPRIRHSDCGRPRCRRGADGPHGRSRDDGIRHCADAAASAPPLAQLCECPTARHIHHKPLWVTSPAAPAVVPGQGSEIPEQRKQSSHQQS